MSNEPNESSARLAAGGQGIAPTRGQLIPTLTTSESHLEDDALYGWPPAPESELWDAYKSLAEPMDKEMVEHWDKNLDTLLIFAGLFSAVLTAFLVTSYPLLQANSEDLALQALTDMSAQLASIGSLLRNTTSPVVSAFQPEFHRAATVLVVNVLWFISLVLSLLAALGTLLVRQWIRSYSKGLPPVTRDWAGQRHERYLLITRLRATAIVTCIPIFVQLAVLLFLVGLAIFLWTITTAMGIIMVALCSTSAVIYTFIVWVSVDRFTNPVKNASIAVANNHSILYDYFLVAKELLALRRESTDGHANATIPWLLSVTPTKNIQRVALVSLVARLFQQTSRWDDWPRTLTLTPHVEQFAALFLDILARRDNSPVTLHGPVNITERDAAVHVTGFLALRESMGNPLLIGLGQEAITALEALTRHPDDTCCLLTSVILLFLQLPNAVAPSDTEFSMPPDMLVDRCLELLAQSPGVSPYSVGVLYIYFSFLWSRQYNNGHTSSISEARQGEVAKIAKGMLRAQDPSTNNRPLETRLRLALDLYKDRELDPGLDLPVEEVLTRRQAWKRWLRRALRRARHNV